MASAVRAALYSALTADATLTTLLATDTSVHHDVAPLNAPFPYIVISKTTGTPTYQFHSAHIQDELWLVKAVDVSPSASAAEAIAARIDQVLTDASIPIAGNLLLAIYRDADVAYAEPVDTDVYRHCGGRYCIVTQPA